MKRKGDMMGGQPFRYWFRAFNINNKKGHPAENVSYFV